jgi:AraC-like DNA-binding protein
MESKIYEWIEFKPDMTLSKYIETYWVSTTNSLCVPAPQKIFPDGCSELLVNTGGNTLYLDNTAIKPGIVYLAGTHRGVINFTSMPNSSFFGITFKPGGFSSFFKIPLYEVAGQFTDVGIKELAFISNCEDRQLTISMVNAFFMKRLSQAGERCLSITGDLYLTKGAISIDDLSKRHNIELRSLERLFKNNVGVTPKELSKIIRFQSVLKRLKDKNFDGNLLPLALEMGYYDHSHFTNEIKEFSELTPSQLRLFFNS